MSICAIGTTAVIISGTTRPQQLVGRSIHCMSIDDQLQYTGLYIDDLKSNIPSNRYLPRHDTGSYSYTFGRNIPGSHAR
jgi:hypothetical protein